MNDDRGVAAEVARSTDEDLPTWLRRSDDAWLVSVRVQPAGGRSRLVGVHGDSIRVRVSAPANEGKANSELVRFLARTTGVRRSEVEIVSGQRSRDKVVRVAGDVSGLLAALPEGDQSSSKQRPTDNS